MRRRDFITLLGGAVVAWPVAALGQQGEPPRRIAVFGAVAANRVMGPAYQAFLDELRRVGFVDGQNLVVDHRPSDQDTARLSEWAVEMVRANPDVLVALGSESTLQVWVRASQNLPIVFVANNYDPI